MANNLKGRGRGGLPVSSPGERAALGAYLRAKIAEQGGRAVVAEQTGISTDSLSKWSGGRAVPARASLEVMCQRGMFIADDCVTVDDLTSKMPWLATKYRAGARPARNQEIAVPAPRVETTETQPVPHNLLDAILAEPNLTVKQRAQLAGLITMVVNGVNLDITISPRS